MNKVKIPDSLSASSWDAGKKDIAKDKAVSSKVDGGKLATAVGALSDAYAGLSKDLDKLGDAKGLTAASAAGALDKFDAAATSAVKAVSAAASAAGKAASELSVAAGKFVTSKEAGKAATALKNTYGNGPKDATAFASAVSDAVDAARKELSDACDAVLKKQNEKKPAPAPVKANPKALADAKFLSALMRKSIALLRTPKGSPLTIKFMVLFNKANPKDLRLYLGPKPESGLAKLKTQFPPEVKVNRVKDPKGKVVWDKGALTFLSDILKGGLAKQIQLSIRQQTKVTVKVRIKRSDGAVDEADAKDVSDDELKMSPADEAEINAGGSDWEATLVGLKKDIDAATGPHAKRIKELSVLIEKAGKAEKFDVAADGLNELQSLLEEGNVADSDGKDLQASDAATDLKQRLDDLGDKIKAAIDGKNDASKQIAQFRDGALQLLKKADKSSVDNAAKFVDKIEELLSAAAASKFPADKVATARTEWLKSRKAAIDGITVLSHGIAKAFAADAAQKKAVAAAVRKLGEVQIKLQTGLDNELNLAINAKDPRKQANMVDRARDSVSALRDLMQKDEVLKSIDKHDVPGVASLEVVGKMLDRLNDIERALQ